MHCCIYQSYFWNFSTFQNCLCLFKFVIILRNIPSFYSTYFTCTLWSYLGVLWFFQMSIIKTVFLSFIFLNTGNKVHQKISWCEPWLNQITPGLPWENTAKNFTNCLKIRKFSRCSKIFKSVDFYFHFKRKICKYIHKNMWLTC